MDWEALLTSTVPGEEHKVDWDQDSATVLGGLRDNRPSKQQRLS